MTNEEWGRHLAQQMPPLSDEECQRAARLLYVIQSQSEAAA
jgi:hypothetical protein